jgi:fructokinase
MILCCGEALIDMLPVPVSGSQPPSWTAHPGGAVFNTAIGIARLGAATGLMSGLSTDGFGDMLRSVLDAEMVDYSLSATSERKTTLAFVALKDGQASYSFHDEGSALRALASSDLRDLPDEVEALFFGGISLVNEPCGSTFESVLMGAAENRVIMLDPNIRPAFIPEPDAYLARLERMMAQADIVKLSDEDLAWMAWQRGSEKDPLRQILDLGAQVVIVTEGSAGAKAITRSGQSVRVSAWQTDVVDTVGAGDTFNAGVLARLADFGALKKSTVSDLGEEALREALEYGAAAAALAVSKPGAQPPSRADLEALLAIGRLPAPALASSRDAKCG